jgi:signal peptidase I
MKKLFIIVSILSLTLILGNILLFQIYKIPTTSMVPVLMPGDKVLVNKFIYGLKIPFTDLRLGKFNKLKRGEVIVFVPPQEFKKPWFRRKKHYIKRLIGLSGDRILIKQGNIYIDGKEVVDARMTNYYYNQGQYAQEGEETLVPEGKYFFLGDNSISSSDSRFWGFVEARGIVGKAIFVWAPGKGIYVVE